jgi:ATP/maltotriose-dependent transcriptional regulator MalT
VDSGLSRIGGGPWPGGRFISEAAVKSHLLHIYAKLGVNDRAAAVAVAFERGLFNRS